MAAGQALLDHSGTDPVLIELACAERSAEIAFRKGRTDLREWTKQKDMDFHIVHSSGHASSADLYRMAQAVAPQRLLPIHTVHPERYAHLSSNTEFAANGEWVAV